MGGQIDDDGQAGGAGATAEACPDRQSPALALLALMLVAAVANRNPSDA